jgi:hypothetical protein
MGKRTNTKKDLVRNSDMKRSCERSTDKLKCKAIPAKTLTDG